MTVEPKTDRVAVELQDVGRIYPGPPPVSALRAVNLTVRGAEYLSVVGPSGSGKSTMLHLLGLLDSPTSGTVRLDGNDVGELGDRQRTNLRSEMIGFVFQSFYLLEHRTAVQNVELSLLRSPLRRRDREATARSALQRVGLGHRLDFMPSQLSGGERQRVAIARAIAKRPYLLLADEPTGNLDRETGFAVLALFESLRDDGQTIIIITHDDSIAKRADRCVVMQDGELFESDS